MNWIELTTPEELKKAIEESKTRPVVLFKHSTRCSISSMAKSRLDRAQTPEGISFYYLDLIKYRAISNQIAEELKVYHESPQILLLLSGECVYDTSHGAITMEDISQQARLLRQ